MPRLTDFVDEFAAALKEQLQADEKRRGDTWLHRPVKEQEARAFDRFCEYEEAFLCGEGPMLWLKVAGEALICWVRENHPEVMG